MRYFSASASFALISIFLLSFLSGCTAMSVLPSVRNCEYIKYERREVAINFVAHCHLQRGEKDNIPVIPGL